MKEALTPFVEIFIAGERDMIETDPSRIKSSAFAFPQ
jgi:hypothetical protein